MATLFYKWWAIPVLSISFLIKEAKSPEVTIHPKKTTHPIHISTAEIIHNATDKSLEVTCKIFWDDFETILTKNNKNVRVDLTDEKSLVINNKLVSAYLNNHLSLVVDGIPVSLSYVGFEKEDLVIYVYMEVSNISTVKKISITNSIMHDMFDDQVEIIHVIVNGNRKSIKLEYPDKLTEFNF